MISVGMNLYKKDGKEVTIYYISGDNIWVTSIDETIVTFNNGLERRIQEVVKNETYFINDIGKSLFYNYLDTPGGIFEEEKKKELELLEKQRKQSLKELENTFKTNYLASKKFWEEDLKELINEEEFNKLTVKFVHKWFKKQNWQLPDHDQAKCIGDVFNDILVIARAGSGKTATIINRAAFLVEHCKVSPSEILILTFNREAANEVNKRLGQLIGEYGLQAMTFHALAYGIVHPEEELIFDDEDSGHLKSKTIQAVIDSYIKNEMWGIKIRNFMLQYFKTDWEMIEIGGYNLSPEDMISYRRSIPKLGLDGNYYKSAGEKQIADFLFEFDIVYEYEKNFWWDEINYKPDFSIPSNNSKYKAIIIEYYGMTGDKSYDEQTYRKSLYWKNKSDYIYMELFPKDNLTEESLINILENNIKRCGLKLRKISTNEMWLRIKDRAVDDFSKLVSQFIGRCRKNDIDPSDLKNLLFKEKNKLSQLDFEFIDIVSEIYSEYLNMLVMNNEEDFDGLLIRAEKMVESGQTRWRRRSGSGDLRNIKYLFIDEYQDFSLLFYKLIESIRNINRELKLFCVGDNWQAINGFAGSDLKFFNNFNHYFKNSKELILKSNYRSYKNIIDVSNALMKDEGVSSENINNELGEVYTLYVNVFTPNDFEKSYYKGDVITPALIRVINTFIEKGQRVALLTRRKNGINFFNNHSSKNNRFHANILSKIREAFPEDKRAMIIDINTTHSYKGKEEDAIIIVDALYRSYPLIHPSNIFFRIIGSTIDSIIDEEKRLFYVGLSRAKKSLVIVTEKGNESPFLMNNILKEMDIKSLDINKLNVPKRNSTHYMINVYNSSISTYNGGTYAIRSDLKNFKYNWDVVKKAWIKHYSAKEFSIDKLLNESWIKKAHGIVIFITDEFNNRIHEIVIHNGSVIK